jgi:uncharacterized protein (TIGR02145 family)
MANKACPSGWHLPSNDEWEELVDIAGGVKVAGVKLKAKSGWIDYKGKSGNGTDDYGFSALPGGYLGSIISGQDGREGHWWSTSEFGRGLAKDVFGRLINHRDEYATWSLVGKSNLLSVRCLQNGNKKSRSSVPSFSSSIPSSSSSVPSSSSFNNVIPDLYDSRDGQTYKIVAIGTQIWMAENLNYDADGSRCYNNNSENCKKYGRLYNWSTALKACPSGWHLPSNAEWTVLEKDVGGKKVAEKKLKAKSGWKTLSSVTEDFNGTDEFGFSAQPGGYGSSNGRDYSGDRFYYVDYSGYWWSASEGASNSVYYRYMLFNNYEATFGNKSDLFSVRCLQD